MSKKKDNPPDVTYSVLTGMDFVDRVSGREIRVDAGGFVLASALAPESIAWLLEQGHIKESEAN